MAQVHLMCGVAGAGKTTLACQLEQRDGMVRYSPDEWILALLDRHDNVAERDRLRTPVEQLQLHEALRHLDAGRDVVLENGFWTRADRARYRARLQDAGHEVILHYLAAAPGVLEARIRVRNADLPAGSFHIPLSDLRDYMDWFEPPGDEETHAFDGYQFHDTRG